MFKASSSSRIQSMALVSDSQSGLYGFGTMMAKKAPANPFPRMNDVTCMAFYIGPFGSH